MCNDSRIKLIKMCSEIFCETYSRDSDI